VSRRVHFALNREDGHMPAFKSRALFVLVSVLAMLSLAGCNDSKVHLTVTCQTLTVGDPSGLTGGFSTPVGAALDYMRGTRPIGMPKAGWKVISHTDTTAVMRADISYLYAAKGADGTWFISSFKVCRRQ
jgi:hypothetical protein